ncbi:nose resistant to fluoxetine protein 6 [Trichonephila clavipes]|nr:nose resistant to fluoxetine protein 6 [Trichonephila clavipes]
MVWGCMSSYGVGRLHIVTGAVKAMDYIEILQNKLLSTARDLFGKQSWIFKDDNAPCHRAKVVQKWLKDHTVNIMNWPDWLEKCKSFFNCFCMFTNGEKILNTTSTEGQLPCLHGIRFLSMSWVILCHGYGFASGVIRNTADIANLFDSWTFQVVLNGFYSVDAFFVLSGFLVAYLFFQQAAKTDGKIPWLYFYIHRFIRLTPVYMMVIAFYTTLMSHLGSGPLWSIKDTDPNCQASWWWNILYINNFQTSADQCMGWAWYLANDMQFYVISPLFLITLFRWPKIGYSLVALFLSITFTANFVLTYEYNLLTGLANAVVQADRSNVLDFVTR